VLEEEGQSDWIIWANFVTNLVKEYAMAAEIRDAKALEPRIWLRQNIALTGHYGRRL